MTRVSLRHRVVPNLHSIRWRLPLTYAGIALLTAVALSALLLVTLKNHYDRQERKYLDFSARILVRPTERLLSDQLAVEELQSTINLFSFVAQARVRVLDVNNQVMVDSGPVHEQGVINVNWDRRDDTGEAGVWVRELGPFLSLPEPGLPQNDDPPPPYDYRLPVRRGAFGQLLTEDASPGRLSSQRVTIPMHGLEDNDSILGYLELSEGPAFGSEIVQDVAGRGVVAGAFAMLIAVGMGIIVSRNINRPVLALADVTRQMAQGDLAARVTLSRRDEFGLLAGIFNTMAGRVEATVSTLKQFVADAAHEINTPLTALRTNLEMTATDDIPTTARADIQQALAELTRLEKLTRNLLTLARLEVSTVMPERSPVELTALLRQLHERYASRAEQAGTAFEIVVPDAPVTIAADPEQITRLFDNLLDNALKFTPDGGRVELGLCRDHTAARAWVRDTGIGIPDGDLPRLFSRFHRGRNAAAYPGNGLGLVIAKAIVTDHGGQIAVESGAEGTCFTVSLPCQEGGCT